MSRIPVQIKNPHLQITAGSDHMLGSFFQIQDDRYANSGKDEQGEGYVFEWDSMFGISTNLIGATRADMTDHAKLSQLCDIFADTLNKRP